jgi:hypothetical protein
LFLDGQVEELPSINVEGRIGRLDALRATNPERR